MPTNPIVMFTAPGKVAIENVDIPALPSKSVLVKVTKSLISVGTELTILGADAPEGTHWSNYFKGWPKPSGYCTTGEVIEAGSEVDRSWIGKTVAGYGPHTRYAAIDISLVREVRREIPSEHAVFATMAEIALNGVRRSGITWGESAAVFGLGILGQIAVRACRLAGAKPVLGVDISDLRLAKLPDDDGVIGVNSTKNDLNKSVEKLTRNRGVDCVIEFTGNPNVIPEALKVLRQLGRAVIASSPRGPTEFNFHDLCSATGQTIIGAPNWAQPTEESKLTPWSKKRHVELFFDWVADKEFDMSPLVSHVEKFTQAPALYEMLLKDRSGAMGVVLDWDE